jgi:hypothetical protein
MQKKRSEQTSKFSTYITTNKNKISHLLRRPIYEKITKNLKPKILLLTLKQFYKQFKTVKAAAF